MYSGITENCSRSTFEGVLVHNDLAVLQYSDKLVRGDKLHGIFKAIVEDDTDPKGIGHVRIRVYALHGTEDVTPISLLPWAEPVHSESGQFNIPEVGDRVWVMFETGDRTHPVYLGHWLATPVISNASWSTPYGDRQGSETPKECWLNYRRRPQAASIARSKEGNQVWFEDKTVGGNYVGRVMLQNSGGAFFRITTHIQGTDYEPWFDYATTRYRKQDESDTDALKEQQSEVAFGTRAYKFFSETGSAGQTRNRSEIVESGVCAETSTSSSRSHKVESSSDSSRTLQTDKSIILGAGSINMLGEFKAFPAEWD